MIDGENVEENKGNIKRMGGALKRGMLKRGQRYQSNCDYPNGRFGGYMR
jgi:hypothetical protein